MKCVNHPDNEAATICINCSKALCSECRVIIHGKNYCNDCGKGIIEIEKNPHSLVIVIGYLCAIFVSLIGIIIGAWLWGQDHTADKLHGKIIVIVGAVLWILGIILILTGFIEI